MCPVLETRSLAFIMSNLHNDPVCLRFCAHFTDEEMDSEKSNYLTHVRTQLKGSVMILRLPGSLACLNEGLHFREEYRKLVRNFC